MRTFMATEEGCSFTDCCDWFTSLQGWDCVVRRIVRSAYKIPTLGSVCACYMPCRTLIYAHAVLVSSNFNTLFYVWPFSAFIHLCIAHYFMSLRWVPIIETNNHLTRIQLTVYKRNYPRTCILALDSGTVLRFDCTSTWVAAAVGL